VVQNSLREGFGLTVTEAMWKRVPLLSSSKPSGPRQQVRDGLDGKLISDPEDLDELAEAIRVMLKDTPGREAWGRNAQRRTHQRFLVFSQLRDWIGLLSTLV
jgi:trehalose synthase